MNDPNSIRPRSMHAKAALLCAVLALAGSGCAGSHRGPRCQGPTMQFRNPVQVDVVESQGTGGNAVMVDAAWARDVGPGGWSQCLLCGSYRLESAPHGTVSITNDLSDPQVPVEGRAGTFAFLVVLAEDDTIRLSLFGYQDSWTDDSQSDDAHPGGSHRGGSHRDEFENDGRALADTCVRLRRSPEGSERAGPPSRGSAPGDE